MAVNTPVQIQSEVIRDKRGRWIKAPVSPHPITAENTHEYARRRRELKQATIQAAANEAVERADWRAAHGDMAFVAALAQTAYIKATTPDDPKAIDAARFLLQESGLSDKQEQVQGVTNNVLVLDDATRGLLLSLLSDTYATPIDAVAEDVDAVDNNSYRNHSADVPPPLPHLTTCPTCANDSTAHSTHEQAHSPTASRQAGTGQKQEDE